jgi:hypothetical protein
MVAFFFITSNAEAAGTCAAGSARTSQDYAFTDAVATYGAVGQIERRDPQLCTGTSGAFTNAFTMVAGHNSAEGYAQVGFAHYRKFNGNTGFYWFSEWASCDTCIPLQKFFPGDTQTYYWKVSYNFTYNRFSMIRGSSSLDNTGSFDPFAHWTTPFAIYFAAETTNTQSDVIGTQADAAGFNGLQRRHGDGTWGSISDLTLPTPQNSGRYHNKWGVKPQLFYVWTYPL